MGKTVPPKMMCHSPKPRACRCDLTLQTRGVCRCERVTLPSLGGALHPTGPACARDACAGMTPRVLARVECPTGRLGPHGAGGLCREPGAAGEWGAWGLPPPALGEERFSLL